MDQHNHPVLIKSQVEHRVFRPWLESDVRLTYCFGMLVDDTDGTDCSARDLLLSWGSLPEGGLQSIRCLIVAEPVGRLIRVGAWRSLPFRMAWCMDRSRSRVHLNKQRLLFDTWPPTDSFALELRDDNIEALFLKPSQLLAEDVDRLRRDLCELAPRLLSSVPESQVFCKENRSNCTLPPLM